MVLNQNAARNLLEQYGWTMTRGGKHVVKMTKPGERPITRTCAGPNAVTVSSGTVVGGCVGGTG
jgi:hypothetical protein